MMEQKRILITGATGYIGRRLKDRLLADERLRLRLLVRNVRKVRPSTLARVEVVEGDTFNPEALAQAVEGVDTAYYLIHSMGAGKGFEEMDRRSAGNFRDACVAAGVRRIIYLGGLGVKETASRHLLSRIETGEILSARGDAIQTVWFRASVIIGAGSASFEMLRSLVQKLPVMIAPRWVSTRTQPVSVEDVLHYLVAALDLDYPGNQMVDIGGEILSFRDMMLTAAREMGLRRIILPVPVLTPHFSAYWVALFTPVSLPVVMALVEGLRSETVVRNNLARQLFPEIHPMSCAEAVRQALREQEEREVLSRWCDASLGAVCDITGEDDPSAAVLRDCQECRRPGIPAEALFLAACTVGGKTGWFTYHFLWRLRGFIDKLFGGCGLSRGRRAGRELRVGDALDFWKVVDIRPGKRLLLAAQMKLPGKAWLEFDASPGLLVVTAHFLPSGLWGRLYWYAVAPFHALVFRDLARQVCARAAGLHDGLGGRQQSLGE